MAECSRFICDTCEKAVDSWSDGNPYFINDRGEKQYAYHPNHADLARCEGNDVPYFCLECGMEFEVDSRQPDVHCSYCKAANTVEAGDLSGKPCPACKNGTFSADPDFFAIS